LTGSFLGFIITGLVYYLLRKKYLCSKGIPLENLKKNEVTWDV